MQTQIQEFEQELTDVEHDVYAEHQDEIDGFKGEIAQLNEQLAEVNRQAAELLERMKPQWQAMAEKLKEQQPEPDILCPEFDGVEDGDPLFDSTRVMSSRSIVTRTSRTSPQHEERGRHVHDHPLHHAGT